jgi:negative regulator of replication initiation
MRTTLNLDDDVLDELKSYAENRDLALGKAASDLLRRGLTAPLQTRLVNGFHTVVLPEDTPKVSSERVRQLLEDEI